MTTTKNIPLVKPTKLLKKVALDYRQEHFNTGEYVINGSDLFDKITDYDELYPLFYTVKKCKSSYKVLVSLISTFLLY